MAKPKDGSPSTRGRTEAVRETKPRGRRRFPWLLILGGAVIGLGLVAAALWILPGHGAFGPRGASGHNLLLITLDTTRADHLGCYGYAQASTPNLDRLAGEGIRFARVYAPAPLTLPSHSSIMTGLYPATHGVRNNGHDLAPKWRTLAGILKARGFATAAFVSSFSVDSRFGIGRGFDVYDDTFQPQAPLKGANAERRAEGTFARFSRWLDGNGSNRFFAWVHYYDPHLPYDPPSPYREASPGRPYDGEIAYMDHYVGALLDALEAKGLRDKTLVVVAGDHGEGLGDKVETGHGIFLYDETLRVPLIVNDRQAFRRPRVVEGAVRLVDAAPTILETLGLKAEASGMEGRSLVPAIKGKTSADLDCLIETFYPRENFGWSELVGLVSGPWKYIQAPRPELYDLKNDPRETADLAASSPEKAGELRRKLEQELLRLTPSPGAASGQAVARTDDRERLRSLGYVNFAPATPGSAAPDPKDKIGLLKLVQQAQAFELEGRFAEAERADREIVAAIPDSPESYVNLAIVQARQNEFGRALETLGQGLARLPDSEVLLVRLGHTYLVSGRAPEALQTMEKVLAINPQSVDALTVAAGILDAGGRKGEARTYYERALAVEPESRHLRMSYAGNLASTGSLKEAIVVYEKLIVDFPEEQAFYQYAGIAHSFLGEYDQAISLLRQALAIRPTPIGYFNLAVAYEKRGDLKEAAEALRMYLRNAQGETEANVRKARAELENLEKKIGSAP
ncbi:MAG TPA: sulfatase-like hydrolase/transferase [Acidobacteriota bacterium]|nr:sulfatase-like hydrolase/transferase [Acidobacteriota bacterium]